MTHLASPFIALPSPLFFAWADLSVGTKGTLVGTMVAGALLLLFGARLLRPAVVLAAMLIGLLAAVVVTRAMLPTVPLWVAAALGAIAGLLAGALLYRPTVGLAAGVIGSAVGALVAFAVMAGGSLDTAPRDLGHALVVNPREIARHGDGMRAGMHVVDILNGPTIERADPDAARAQSGIATESLAAGDRLLRSCADIAHRALERITLAYQETQPAYRTLLTASIIAGAVIGFLAGLVATTMVARIITSFAGAWLLFVGLLPLLALHGHDPLPPDARIWLVSLAFLAAVGTVVQSLLSVQLPSAPKSSAPAKVATKKPIKRTNKPANPAAVAALD